MNRNRLFTILLIGLLISNILLVVFIFRNKPHGPGHHGPRNLIIERLELTPDQIAQYDQLIQSHRSDIRRTEAHIMDLKQQLYRQLSQNGDSLTRDSLLQALGKAQIAIESAHFRHFQALGKLCTPQQQKAFRDLTIELAALFSPPPPHKRPGKGRR